MLHMRTIVSLATLGSAAVAGIVVSVGGCSSSSSTQQPDGGESASSSGAASSSGGSGAGSGSTSGAGSGGSSGAGSGASSGAGSGGSSGAGSGGSSGAGSGSGSGTGSGSSTGDGASNTVGGIFTQPEPWTKDVSSLTKDPSSDAIIAALVSSGGWGNGRLQIDFSIPLFFASASTPKQTITGPSGGGYCGGGPDCDAVPLKMPIPANGNIEGSTNYTCDTSNNDCHLLVVDTSQQKLFELYNATLAGSAYTAGGAFVWDLTKAYPDNERGEQCTSADAGGFPIAGLLPTADEVAAGAVNHAIRFILPNARMKKKVYVHPASHAGAPSSTDANAPPYGVRFRLKAAFDETPFSTGAKVILKAMKTYGMLLSDGGNIALTFADDRTTNAKWAGQSVTAQSFAAIKPGDFEVVDLGADIPLTYNCVRNP